MPKRFCLKRPCLPLSISDRDFKGLLLGPVTGLPRLPLSISASTASWSIRFSLRTIMSGAPSSRSLFKRLFLFMTLLYRSLRSLVAKRPPSSCTMGRISGGITGTTSSIIHSGLFPEALKDSTTSRRFKILMRFCPLAASSSSRSSMDSFSGSISESSSFMASAPIDALKSSSYFSCRSLYSFSVRVCIFVSSRTSPGSVTI